MDEDLIKEIENKAIWLSGDLFAIIRYGKMIILEKVNVYGAGYREIITFTFDDFEKLKAMATREEELIR
jgi:hypothetical protein